MAERDDDYTAGMTADEKENYKTLRASPKGWSRSEARDMATNPGKRLAPVASRAEKRYGSNRRFYNSPIKNDRQRGVANISGSDPDQVKQGIRELNKTAPAQRDED